MSETNKDNLEDRFDAGERVIGFFDTDIVLTVDRPADLATILNLSAIARESGMNVQTLQRKVRRRTPLSGDETRKIIETLKRHRLMTVA